MSKPIPELPKKISPLVIDDKINKLIEVIERQTQEIQILREKVDELSYKKKDEQPVIIKPTSPIRNNSGINQELLQQWLDCMSKFSDVINEQAKYRTNKEATLKKIISKAQLLISKNSKVNFYNLADIVNNKITNIILPSKEVLNVFVNTEEPNKFFHIEQVQHPRGIFSTEPIPEYNVYFCVVNF
jgi:hypothetical protein